MATLLAQHLHQVRGLTRLILQQQDTRAHQAMIWRYLVQARVALQPASRVDTMRIRPEAAGNDQIAHDEPNLPA
jgi:hypothetical protein